MSKKRLNTSDRTATDAVGELDRANAAEAIAARARQREAADAARNARIRAARERGRV